MSAVPTGRSAKEARNSENHSIRSVAKRKRNKRQKENFKSFLYKTFKQVHPDISISTSSMHIMDSFVNDIFERIATEASRLAHHNNSATVASREIQSAIRLLLPGTLYMHSDRAGKKALKRYNRSFD